MTRVCCDCKIEKDIEQFHYSNKAKGIHKYYCKNCAKIRNISMKELHKEYNKEWYKKNKEKRLIQTNQWKKDNKEHRRATDKIWMENNKEHMRIKRKEWYDANKDKILAQKRKNYHNNIDHYRNMAKLRRRKYYQNDINFRIKANVHRSINKALQGDTTQYGSIKDLLEYTIEQLRAHLELLFEDWMNWENYGRGEEKWQIDHIIPQWAYDFCQQEEIKKCWDLRNLRPLSAIENNSKNGKIDLKLVSEYLIEDLMPEVLLKDSIDKK